MDLLKVFDDITDEQAAKRDEEIAQLIAQREAEEREQRFKKSGVPERYLDQTLETYKTTTDVQKTAKAAAERFLREIKCGSFKSLVLIGNAGVGKTHLACAVIREYDGGKYRTAPDIIEELRRAKSFTANETEGEIVSYYGRVPLLVIDEIGRGINAVDEKYMLYKVLNARYNSRRPTLLISNHSKADFLQYIGVAAADRLVESAEIVELKGDSYRKELRGAK